jgi:3-methyladenine DNA glycosylase/8-oxoguanine DNA glycosylase
MQRPDATRMLRLSAPLDLVGTLGPSRRGVRDPTMYVDARRLRRASNTPDGPAALHVSIDAGATEATVEAWGPGADWLCTRAPAVLGELDDPGDFNRRLTALRAPGADLLRQLVRRHAGVRIPRTGAVVETTVPVVLEQKVIGQDAWASYRGLVVAHGLPAPGPDTGSPMLRLPPGPAVLKRLPGAEYHRHGVERRRADTLRRVCEVAPRLDEDGLADAEVTRRLGSVPGLGPWTVAEVARVALGDADAVSVGDFHLPHQVAFAFLGQARGDDDLLLELLEPYRPHRGRVIRLLVLGGPTPPRRGPRLRRSSIRGR